MAFKGGVQEAAKMLAGLDSKARVRVLEKIKLLNPAMADQLEKKMFTLEDLQYLTPKMVVDFTRKIDLKDLGLALRGASSELREFFLKQISKSMQEDILFTLKGPPVILSKVQEAEEKVMAIAREMKDKGEIVLSREDEMV